LTSKTPWRSVSHTAPRPPGDPPSGGTPASMDAAPHDSCDRTDFAGNASSAVTASAGGRDGAGNPGRDAAARPIATRCGGEAGDVIGGSPAGNASPRRRRTRSGGTLDECGRTEDLEGEPSPWETRATRGWKRRRVATDSSAEESLEASCSTRAALTAAPGNGCGRRSQSLECGRTAGQSTSVAQARRAISLQGRLRDAPRQDLRVPARRRTGTGQAGSPVRSSNSSGDVEVRLGGSEHPQGSAPTLRTRRHPGGSGGRPGSGRMRLLAPSGVSRRPRSPRRPDPLAPSSEVRRAASTPASAGRTRGIRAGLGPRGCCGHPAAPAARARHARLRPGALGLGRAGSDTKGVWQRQEGNGRSDAVRLLTRGTLRRV
jgi:hypothetical protein